MKGTDLELTPDDTVLARNCAQGLGSGGKGPRSVLDWTEVLLDGARCDSEASDSDAEADIEAECILEWLSTAQRSLATVETFAFHWSKGVCVF